MTRPRLCFVVESGTDVRLAEGLDAAFEVTLLGRSLPGGRVISHPPARPVPVVLGPASRLAFAAFAGRHLLRHAGRYDAVLVQGYGPAALAANLASRLTGVPTAMLVCSPVEEYYRCRRGHPEPGKPYRRAELAALGLLARINARLGRGYVVLSRHLADVVRGHGTRRPVHHIPLYGVDTTRFRPTGVPRAALRARLSLPPDGAVIFFSSRVAPEKDAETLLEAFRRLRAAGRDVWLLHRSGGHRGFLRAAEAAGVADRVVATDAVHPDRLPEDYQACDLCVQASRAEGLGFSPLEALACGVPVVATAVGGLTETVRDRETGWTYPAGDAGALAACVAAALDDPAEARRRAAAGRALVVAEYGREDAFARLLDLFTPRPAGGLTPRRPPAEKVLTP
jgi:glycosyltransferase involved in cell wall biosynthesis